MTWYGKSRKNVLLILKFQLVLHAKSLSRQCDRIFVSFIRGWNIGEKQRDFQDDRKLKYYMLYMVLTEGYFQPANNFFCQNNGIPFRGRTFTLNIVLMPWQVKIDLQDKVDIWKSIMHFFYHTIWFSRCRDHDIFLGLYPSRSKN